MLAVNRLSNLTPTDLRHELERLSQLRPQLARRLADAAEQLELPGLPPSSSLIDELQAYRQMVLHLAATIGIESNCETGISLLELERRIEARGCRQYAESVREQLSDLIHVDVPDFAPLVLCQREASRLCELASEAIGPDQDPELELLRHERHALNSLIRLCDEGQHLSDADWTACHDDVAATYGRQLATALTRGRIHRRTIRPVCVPAVAETPVSINVQTAVPAVPQSVEVAPVPQPVLPARPVVAAADSVLEPDPERQMVFEVSSSKPGSALRLRGGLAGLDPTQGKSARIEPTPAAAAALNSPAAVRNEIAAPTTRFGVSTSDCITRLLSEGRLVLALHLVRCQEQRFDQSIAIPSWLLRAVILGRHLSYSKGEIARQLEDELKTFRTEMLTEGSEERRLTLAFLARAAAIPAALLAGSPAASGLLRSFKIAPGFSQLYNYCSRVAIYGDRLAGNLVEMFRPAGSISGASELEQLSQSAHSWLQEISRKAVAYNRSSPLFLHAHWTLTAGTAVRYADEATIWCKWQEALTLAHRLLKPVCDGAVGERNWVRQEISRLSQVRVEPLDSAFRQSQQSGMGPRAIVFPSEEMHAVILEAIAIANRWLRLCHQTALGGGSPVPLEALELREEILKRSDGVLAELSEHRQSAESPLVKAAIGCCQQGIRQIHAMFESRLSLPLVEPDPRHALNGDLLRIPGIELNEQWLPESEPAVVERELIASLDKPELTWKQSFDYHASIGNHAATGQLLELDVWSNVDERDALRVLRQTQIAENRAAIEDDLKELADDITTIGETGRWSDAESIAFQKRLERLRQESPRVQDFVAFRRQLNQFQSAVLRQQAGPGIPMSLMPGSGDVDAGPARAKSHIVREPVIQSCDIFTGE